MLSFLLYALGIAVIDSLNPSAIGLVIVILLNARRPVIRALVYILGIYVTNFTMGLGITSLVILSGISYKPDWSVVGQLITKPPLWTVYAQVIVGIVLIIYPYLKKQTQDLVTEDNKPSKAKDKSLFGTFILGVTVTFVEFSTALPYLGVITALANSSFNFGFVVTVLLGYNVIFVMPPMMILALYYFQRRKFQSQLTWIKTKYHNVSKPLFKYGCVTIGIIAIVDSVLRLNGFKIY